MNNFSSQPNSKKMKRQKIFLFLIPFAVTNVVAQPTTPKVVTANDNTIKTVPVKNLPTVGTTYNFANVKICVDRPPQNIPNTQRNFSAVPPPPPTINSDGTYSRTTSV